MLIVWKLGLSTPDRMTHMLPFLWNIGCMCFQYIDTGMCVNIGNSSFSRKPNKNTQLLLILATLLRRCRFRVVVPRPWFSPHLHVRWCIPVHSVPVTAFFSAQRGLDKYPVTRFSHFIYLWFFFSLSFLTMAEYSTTLQWQCLVQWMMNTS